MSENNEYSQSVIHLLAAESMGKVGADVIAPIDQAILSSEVAALPDSCFMASLGSFDAYLASAEQIPHLLNEIGRLREISFRAVGEGTGKALDLDRFDQTYLHLFLWHRDDAAVAGAYRLGLTDVLLKQGGPQALYTSTLFDFAADFWPEIDPSLELGRSFVAQPYQKSMHPLSLLWRGIGTFVARNPLYSRLFGPVSISDLYTPASQALMVDYLQQNHRHPRLSNLVQPRNPFVAQSHATLVRIPENVEQLSQLVAEHEEDRKGLPVLIRQYLKLHADVLASNVDIDFNNALDILVLVDLRQTPAEILRRHMGREACQQFLDFFKH